ncbi:MAG: outer membrane beta-barrel protein, partial [Solirubrobacterales bacterium]|nr:outer membrane beta-barrel protein [Solirubrobacterales bacterium]
DSSTTNVQLKENSKITENNIPHIEDENIPSKADEENSKQNLRNKNEDSHAVPESNPNIADQLSAAHEIILNTQPNVNAGDPDKTIAHETEISKSLFPDEIINRNDSAFVNATIHETVNQNTNTSDSLVTVSISNNDSLNVVLKNDTVSDVAAKEEIPMQTDFLNWNVYAGINIYNATNTSLFSQQNISPIIGLEFMYSISPHFNVGLGSLYTLQGGYQLSDTATQETYFLDKNVSQEIIQIRQLHKLYFPLTLYYSIAKRHTVSAAVQLSSLLNTNGDYTEINKISDHTTFTQINDVKGYTDGIKPINVAVSLGYKFLLSTNFDLSARITQELKDSYTSGYFYGAASKPSLSFQTFLIVKF